MALKVIRRLSLLPSLLALVAVLGGSPARAATVTLSFPGPATYWVSQPAASGEAGSGYGTTNPIWHTGSTLTETFTGVGLYSVSSVQFSFSIQSNYLNGGESWDTYLNGQLIGSFTIQGNGAGGGYCYCGGQYISGTTYTFTESFAPIVGNGTYTLEFYLAGGVAPGYGSIVFPDTGSAVLTGDAEAALAYITNSGDGTVSVIDTTNNTVVNTIPVGRKPFGVAVTPDDSKVYIANSGDNTVSVIDTATNTVTGSPIAVGTDPVGVAVTPDGKTVYVTNQGDGTVSVINTTTDTVIGSAIDVGCTIANCGRKTTNIPTGIAVTPDGSKVYVGNLGAPGYASVIATASNTVTTINTKKVTTGVAVTPDGSKVYLGSLNGAVLAIEVATNSVGHGSTIGVGSGSEGVAVTPDGSKVYVADSAVGTVSVINTGTNKVIGSIAVGSDPQGVSVTSDGSKVYVANEGNGTVDGTVSIIDTATNTAESSTITVGKAPLAFGIFIPPPKPK
jgi:YVTN family beta-propeller protein